VSDTGALDPAAADAGLVGTVLAGRYRIVRKLGEGAMGAVYLGEHLRIGRRDAIKVLRPSLAADPEAMARFARGARNVCAIQHPNVCTVYDFSDTEDGRRFLAMELVPGETLQDLLAREGRLSPARAVAIAAQVAGALQAAHDAGIVHRDLKPGNVMVSPGRGGTDAVKVVDFDIAKGSAEGQGGEVTRLGFVIGTPEYMSPEQLLGMPLDGRSDVYSLALVLFRMLAGALPFRAQDTQELMVQRLTGTPLRLDEVLPALRVPPALQDALDRGLQRRAEDRVASAADFSAAITAAVAGAPSDAAPPPSVPDAGRGAWGFTRGGVAATVVTPDGAPSPVAPTRERTRRAVPAAAGRAAAGVLAVAVLLGGAWGISRFLGPPDADAAASEAPATEAAGAVTSLTEAATNPPPVPAAPADSAATALRTAASTHPASGTATAPLLDPPAAKGGGERTARPGRKAAIPATEEEPRRAVAFPSTNVPAPEPPRAREGGLAAENAPAVLGRLSVRMGDLSLSGGRLRAVADSASALWRLGEALPDRQRANAAYLLGTVAFREQDWGGCVQWLERSLQLNPGSASRSRMMLDRCRERGG
jgi:serine/threonine-protein kinase